MASPMRAQILTVRMRSAAARTGWLEFGPWRLPCALGRSGVKVRKREGDGATPAGRWRLEAIRYRGDGAQRLASGLPLQRTRRHDGWCDAPGDRNYNRAVPLPYAASSERMWRDDNLYDVVVVLDHNRRPRVRGLGSAIFLHIARADYSPTEGCVALRPDHLRRLLARLRSGAAISVGEHPRPTRGSAKQTSHRK